MNLLRYHLIPADELLTRLQQTQLMGHQHPFIYRNAQLSLHSQVDPNSLTPAQRYVLTENCQIIERLYTIFLDHDLDIFSLEGGLWFWLEGQTSPIPLTPPIIEESTTIEGQTVNLISDGMHRVYTAKQLGKPITILQVKNLPPAYPYYAYPLSRGWEEVTVLSEFPTGFVKKYYRETDYKALFRNYNAIFSGIQKQRT